MNVSPEHDPASPEHGPVVVPPPGTVRVASLLVAAEAVGLVVLAWINMTAGISHDASGGQLAGQVAYFVVLAGLLVLVASGMWRGRRWGRSPALVAEVVVTAVGMWLAFPSGRLGPGLAVIGVGALTFALLVTPRANHWIRQFPRPFGLDGQGE